MTTFEWTGKNIPDFSKKCLLFKIMMVLLHGNWENFALINSLYLGIKKWSSY